jgi:hypothetical protein
MAYKSTKTSLTPRKHLSDSDIYKKKENLFAQDDLCLRGHVSPLLDYDRESTHSIDFLAGERYMVRDHAPH